MWRKIAVIALIALAAHRYLFSHPPAPSMNLAAEFPIDMETVLSLRSAPVQQPIERPGTGFRYRDYVIEPLATFQLQARVLGAEHYQLGREADLSPVDLALGWEPMADSDVPKHIDISQSGRFYRWRVQHFPIPRRDIETHSANMHMIPASESVRSALLAVKPGQVVQLHGYLVRVRAQDGWRWQSSLTRTDTGRNACEVVLVEMLRTL